MSTTYKSTIEVRCWKEHTCVNCEGTYAYLFERTVTGEAGKAEQASENAHKNAIASMENDIDFHPCPTCGLYQPDMVADRRKARHRLVLWGAIAAFGITLILYLTRALTSEEASLAAIVTAILAFVLNFIIDYINPNINAEANQERGQRGVESGKLFVNKSGEVREPEAEMFTPKWTLAQKVMMLLLLVAPVLMAVPIAMRSVNGWAYNDKWRSPVIGPGDESKLWLDGKINCVKGYWRGTATVLASVADDPAAKPFNCTATTNTSGWGNTISVKSSEKDSTARLWVEVKVPDRAELAGKRLNLKIDMNVEYPAINGNSFDERRYQYTQSVAVVTAAPNAGGTYMTLWWIGFAGGMVLCLFATLALMSVANSFARTANVATLYPYKDDDGDGKQDKRDEENDDE